MKSEGENKDDNPASNLDVSSAGHFNKYDDEFHDSNLDASSEGDPDNDELLLLVHGMQRINTSIFLGFQGLYLLPLNLL